MRTREYKEYLQERLRILPEAAAYLTVHLEQDAAFPSLLLTALRDLSESHNVEFNLTYQDMYTVESIVKLLDKVGLILRVVEK